MGFAPRAEREDRVLLIATVMLTALAAVNAIFITRAAVRDLRHSLAVARAPRRHPGQLTAGLSVAQVLPALAAQ